MCCRCCLLRLRHAALAWFVCSWEGRLGGGWVGGEVAEGVGEEEGGEERG